MTVHRGSDRMNNLPTTFTLPCSLVPQITQKEYFPTTNQQYQSSYCLQEEEDID